MAVAFQVQCATSLPAGARKAKIGNAVAHATTRFFRERRGHRRTHRVGGCCATRRRGLGASWRPAPIGWGSRTRRSIDHGRPCRRRTMPNGATGRASRGGRTRKIREPKGRGWVRESGGATHMFFDLASVTKPMTAVAFARARIDRRTPLGNLLVEARHTTRRAHAARTAVRTSGRNRQPPRFVRTARPRRTRRRARRAVGSRKGTADRRHRGPSARRVSCGLQRPRLLARGRGAIACCRCARCRRSHPAPRPQAARGSGLRGLRPRPRRAGHRWSFCTYRGCALARRSHHRRGAR